MLLKLTKKCEESIKNADFIKKAPQSVVYPLRNAKRKRRQGKQARRRKTNQVNHHHPMNELQKELPSPFSPHRNTRPADKGAY